jgi:EmrB/QacA subfamily drug resistance transporter
MASPSSRPEGAPPGMAYNAPSVPQLTQQQINFTLIGAFLGVLLAALDQTIVATAAPTIQRVLNIDNSLYSWITTAYLVASTVFVPIWGKLSDLYGRKPILLIGISIFLIGSVLCGLSTNAEFLIIARAIQGLGSASLFTSALAIIADIIPAQDRGKYSGLFGAVFGLSSVVGPLVGGFLTDNLSWHWIFYVNIPVGAIALSFIISKMPNLNLAVLKPKIDYLGAITLVVAVIPLLLALSLGKTSVSPGQLGFLWGSTEILGLFALSVVGLIAFIFTERAASDPLLDLSLFKIPTFAIGNLAAFVIGMGFLGAFVFLPLFMQRVVGVSATSSGFAGIPLVFGLVIGNVLSGQLVSRFGRYKPLMLIGLVVMVLGFVLTGFTLTSHSTFWEVVAKMVVMGLGLGPSIPLFTLAIQNAVQPQKIGVATASATFFRQMGSTIGVAILGSVFANVVANDLTPRMDTIKASLPAAMQSQFNVSGGGGFSGEGESSSNGFDATKIKADLTAKLDESASLFTAAVQNNDLEALKKLAASPQTPADQKKQLEDAVSAGGFQNYLKNQIAAQKTTFTKALINNDPVAIKAVLENPQAPEQLKKTLQAGGIAASVKAGFAAQYQAIAAAINSGKPEALKALLANPQLPAPLKAQLSSIPAAAIANPGARVGILAGIKKGLDAAQTGAIAQATQGALAGLNKGLESAQASATKSILDNALTGISDAKAKALPAVDSIGEAIKESFTTGITTVYKLGILIALLALLITAFIPELPLRAGARHAPAAAE